MSYGIDSLDGLCKVTSNEILDDGKGQLFGKRLEARQFGYLLALVCTSNSATDVPAVFEESEGNVGCDEAGNTGDENGLRAGHVVNQW